MLSQYIFILIWICLMAILSRSQYREEYDVLTGEIEEKTKPFFAFIVMAPVIWMAANRGWFADTSAYISGYLRMPSTFAEIPLFMENIEKDRGFSYISAVIHCIFGNNYFYYLAIFALFQGLSLVIIFRKYSENYILSIFLFIASTDYLSWMFNGMRQFTAVALILLATPWMLQKKYIRSILIILLASTLHQSALLMIPVLFIVQGEAWNKKTLLFMLAAVIAVFFVDRFTTFLDDALSGTIYRNVVIDYTSWNDDGTNPLRVLVYSMPALMAFVFRKQIQQEASGLINFCANMSIISMGLYILSMVTSGIFIGRLPIYFSLYGYILLPWELENILVPKFGKYSHLGLVVMYILFYAYAILIQWRIQ